MRFFDQPPGSDFCRPYEAMMDQVARGRTVAVIPVENVEGKSAVYIYSARPEGEITEANTHPTSIRMVMGARRAARSDDYTPVPHG